MLFENFITRVDVNRYSRHTAHCEKKKKLYFFYKVQTFK